MQIFALDQLSKEVNLEAFGSFIASALHLGFTARQRAPSASLFSLGCESQNIVSMSEHCIVLLVEKILTLCLLSE